MFEKALEWSKANKPPRIQELVEPELIYVNASME
jgi:hypothetical protein